MGRLFEARKNELTAVLNRERFDQPPGGIETDFDLSRWYQFRADYHKAQQLESTTNFPLQIDFELNSTCQLKCSFCLHGIEKVQKKLLPFEAFKQVIDEGSKYGLCSIKLNYINEPLLNRELPKYISYARSKGVLNIYFATNGILLTPDTAQKLIYVKLSKIMISLDATTPETFEKVRNSTQYDLIVSNILNLIRLRDNQGLSYPLVRVNFLQTLINIHEADEFKSKWNDIADMVGFQQQVQLPGVESDLLPHRQMKFNKGFRCSFPFKMVVVDSSGDILPCCTFSGRLMPLGNIKDTTIKQAWDSQKMRSLQEIQKAGQYKTNSICLHCVGNGGGSEA